MYHYWPKCLKKKETKIMDFDRICFKGVCDVCGKETQVVTCASNYGPVSFAYCKNCLSERLEPYSALVAYISCAGHFPNEISQPFVLDVKRILGKLKISESTFIHDVDKAIDGK